MSLVDLKAFESRSVTRQTAFLDHRTGRPVILRLERGGRWVSR
jgi:hypothetical protein